MDQIHHKQQRGMTLISFISLSTVVLFGLLLIVRVVPVYMEYFKISTALEKIASNSKENGSVHAPTDIRYAFQRQSEVDDIHSVTAHDLKIDTSGGGYDVSAQYESRTPIVANLSLVIEFNKTVRVERRE